MVLMHGISDFINKGICLMAVCLITIVFNGCSDGSDINQDIKTNDILNTETDSNVTKNISENEYYKIYTGQNEDDRYLFYYDLYNKDKDLIKSECTYMNQPDIILLDNSIIKISVQNGTGLDTQWTYYYDINTEMFSPIYYHVLEESQRYVSYFENSKVIVCDMFSEGLYKKEIHLTNELSATTEPIKNVYFSEDMKTIEITYYTKNDFNEITEIVEL